MYLKLLSHSRGVTSIEAEEAVSSSLFKGPCIITIEMRQLPPCIICLCLHALRILVTLLHSDKQSSPLLSQRTDCIVAAPVDVTVTGASVDELRILVILSVIAD